MNTSSHHTILITGVAGFIGFHLCLQLLQEGVRVVGLDNMNSYYEISLKENRLKQLSYQPEFTFVKADIEDKEAVFRLFNDYHPAVVVNLAAQAGVRYSLENPDAYIDSNIYGFFHILEACRHHSVGHLVYASSSSVYGNQGKVPFSTSDNVDYPISLYAATKKTNELMAYTYSHLYDIPATGLRFFTVYGPFGRPDMAYYSFTQRILRGESIQIYNNGDMYRDFTYIDDIVCGIRVLMDRTPERRNNARHAVYNIGNNHPEKLLDLITILEKELGCQAVKEFLPMQPGDVYQTFADISELTMLTGFRPQTTLADGIRRFVNWYKDYYRIGL
jgi:UDP-glucuronate 4-epimerase